MNELKNNASTEQGASIRIIIPFLLTSSKLDLCDVLSKVKKVTKDNIFVRYASSTYLPKKYIPNVLSLMRKSTQFYDKKTGTWHPNEIFTKYSNLDVEMVFYSSKIMDKNIGFFVIFLNNYRLPKSLKSHSELYREILNQPTRINGKSVALRDLPKMLFDRFIRKTRHVINPLKIFKKRKLVKLNSSKFIYGRPHIVIVTQDFDRFTVKFGKPSKKITEWWYTNPLITFLDNGYVGGKKRTTLRRRISFLIENMYLQGFVYRNVAPHLYYSQHGVDTRNLTLNIKRLLAFDMLMSHIQTAGVLQDFSTTLGEAWGLKFRKDLIYRNMQNQMEIEQYLFLRKANIRLYIVTLLQVVLLILGTILSLYILEIL